MRDLEPSTRVHARTCLRRASTRFDQVELLGEVKHVQLDQGQPSEDEFPAFWAALGGTKAQVPPPVEDSKADDKKAAKETELYRLTETALPNGKRKLVTEKVGRSSRAPGSHAHCTLMACWLRAGCVLIAGEGRVPCKP